MNDTHLARTVSHAQHLLATQRAAEAAEVLGAIEGIFDAQPALYALLGTALRRSGENAAALIAFTQASVLAPDSADYMLGVGLCHRDARDDESARAAYARAVELAPDHPGAHCNLGNVLFDLGDHVAALNHLERAIELAPRLAEAWASLGNILGARAALRDAPPEFRAALRRFDLESVGDHPGRLYKFGTIALHLGWLDEALSYLTRAHVLAPEEPKIQFSLGVTHLSRGNFSAGWPLFEQRRHPNVDGGAHDYPEIDTPRLDSLAAAAGQRVLVLPEQGYGDRLQFCRYLPALAHRCEQAVFSVDAALLELMKSSGLQTCAYEEPPPPHDAHCFVMSLPFLFATTRASIPAANRPYLYAPEEAIRRWRTRLAADSGLRVGINWAGNPRHPQDRYRSIPLLACKELCADLSRVNFYSLQKYTAAPDAHRASLAACGIVDLNDELGDFADAAGLMANLDLVITVDTATAHLAGALGRPVWTLLPSVPDYRWAADGDHSVWYGSMRLFHQATALAWQPLLTEVRQALVLVLAAQA